ncbi:MAG: nitroreductase family protein [Caldicoprobacterales bacterium]|jgi:nitroreductase|nr:nitroreductase family protein [Clostridiales bacterium]
MNEFSKLIKTRRTVRRFLPDKISMDILTDLADCARLAPSASNRQPLAFHIIQKEDLLEPVFQTLSWAGYIRPRGTPREGEKPTAYIVVLYNKKFQETAIRQDAGAAIQNILLAAWSYGIGSCWIGTVNRDELAKVIKLPEDYTIGSVIALGYPAESPVIEESEQTVRYYKDENNVLHVPKKPLKSILFVD